MSQDLPAPGRRSPRSFFRSLLRRDAPARPAPRRRPLVERLEDRTLLDAAALLVQFRPSVLADRDYLDLLADNSRAALQDTDLPGVVMFTGDRADLDRLHGELRGKPDTVYVEFEHTVSVALSPNDPKYTDGTLWGLNGTNGIKAPTAWDTTTGSTKVAVAVIDTGVNYKHADLYLNMWINQGEIPTSVRNAIQAVSNWDVDSDGLITFWDLNDSRNQGTGKITDLDGDGKITGADLLYTTALGGWADGVDNDNFDNNSSTYRDDLIGWDFYNGDNNPNDDSGHGTHVAGTIGAVGDNSTGVVGVNWKVQIVPLKFMGANGSGSDTDGAAATRYAANLGIPISNNSWGGGDYSTTLYNAIGYAGSNGHTFVAAAGNSGANADNSPDYPAAFDLANVISVASITSTGARSSFSNYGATSVDLGAPGSSIYSTTSNGSYDYKSGTSMASPHVAGVAALVKAKFPTLTVAQLKDRLLGTVTPLSSLSGITVSGGLVNAAEAVKDAPEVLVLDGTTQLADGGSTVNVGTTFPSVALTRTFTVKNVGTQTLTLGSTITVPTGFSVVTGFGSTALAAGASTTFQVKLQSATTGNYSGTLSFATDDSDENPFNFTISGTVANKVILDDGDSAFSTTSNWTYWTGQGYLSDVREALAGSGSEVATWAFAVTPGQYRVSATWSAYSNRATNSPYTIYDGASALGTVRVNQQAAPDDLTDAGASWETLGTFDVTGTALLVKLSNDANGRLNADGIRVERLGDLPTGPEVQVLDGTADVADGTGSVGFGSTLAGAALTKTFTVKNVGTTTLNLGSTITVPSSGFTLVSGFGSTALAPTATTTFQVRLAATAAGTYNGEVSFTTDDSDEGTFNFTVSGTVSTKVILDDGDSAFSATSGWTAWTGQGYQSDVREALAGSGSEVATWTFAVTPGQYRVSATWSTYSNRATNSPYTVYDGATALGTVRVNQQAAANDFTDDGPSWEILGTFDVTGTSLLVRLSNDANGRLNADGIHIERLGDIPNGPEVQVLDGTADVADGTGSVNFGTTLTGAALTKTFTVKNAGTTTLNLGSTITVPTGFSVVTGFGSTALAPGATTTFQVKLDAATGGTYNGQISFATDDSDENPFNFAVSGVVSNVKVIDDGDTGFAATSGWATWTGQGHQSDVREAFAGTGSEVATWTFVVAPGRYRVSATWTTYSNRATNSPFTVFDESTSLTTVRVNQQAAPNDFTDGGTSWEDLGTFDIAGASLVVALANDADGRLNADAIRIERVP